MAEPVRLHVRLGGSLAALIGRAEARLELGEPLPLREIAERAGVSPSLVMLYAVNGAAQGADFVPADGDEILLVPAVAGGSAVSSPPKGRR